MFTRKDVNEWIDQPVWIMYAFHRKTDVKMYIAVGKSLFRVTDKNQIVYEGTSMIVAIKVYNGIIAA